MKKEPFLPVWLTGEVFVLYSTVQFGSILCKYLNSCRSVNHSARRVSVFLSQDGEGLQTQFNRTATLNQTTKSFTMAKLSCCLLSIVLVLVILDGTSARRASCGGFKGRSGPCRTMVGLFKRLLQDMDDDEQGNADNERELSPDTKTDEEADLRALLYGQDPDEDPTDTEEGMIANEGEEEMSAYKKRNSELKKKEVEMKLIEALLRDLENNE